MSMYTGLLMHTCQIRERQENTRNSHNEYQWNVKDEQECLFIEEVNTKFNSDMIKDVSISGTFLFAENPPKETDQIIYDGDLYNIITGGIVKRKSFMTGEIELWKVYVNSRREYNNENEITINSRVS